MKFFATTTIACVLALNARISCPEQTTEDENYDDASSEGEEEQDATRATSEYDEVTYCSRWQIGLRPINKDTAMLRIGLTNCVICSVLVRLHGCENYEEARWSAYYSSWSPSNTEMPDWFVDTVVRRYIYLTCGMPLRCNTTADDNERDIVLVKWLSAPATVSELCLFYPRLIALDFLANHFFAFDGIANVATDLSFTISNTPALISFVIAYALPLQISLMLFGLYVIRKSLFGAESHIVIYHNALIYTDIVLCMLSFLKTTKLIPLVVLPACYISPGIAVWFTEIAETTCSTGVDMVYLQANLIQSALACDRFIAMRFPIRYQILGSKTAARIIVACLCALTAVFAACLIATDEVLMPVAILGIPFNSDSFEDGYNPFLRLRYITMTSALSFCFLTQVAACCALLAIIRWRQRSQAARNRKGIPISLLPCYLLMGTCVVNLFGCFIAISFYGLQILETFPDGQSRPETVMFCFHMLRHYRHFIASFLSSLGVWVHCVVSSRYRSVAAAAIRAFVLVGPRSLRKVSFPRMNYRQSISLSHSFGRQNSVNPLVIPETSMPSRRMVRQNSVIPTGTTTIQPLGICDTSL